MKLTPMRYKSYTWPHNPRVYSIDYRRAMAVNQTPFSGYQLQDLGLSHRVMEGEGEFTGEGAYAEFQRLACVFYETGPGLLVHPLWQAANTYFVALRLEQAPRPDYVRYSFEFWEESSQYNGMAVRIPEAQTEQEPASGALLEEQPAGGMVWGPFGDPAGNLSNWMLPTAKQETSRMAPVQIPLQAPAPAQLSSQPTYHCVTQGESLWELSERYGVSVQDLIALNPQMKNPNLIYTGQEVRVR